MALLSPRGYAQHRGCALSTVQLALKTGRIKAERNGKIDPAKADAMWAARTDTRRNRADSDAIGERFQSARSVREAFNAKLAELDYRERSGELISAKDVRDIAFERSRTIRDLLIAVPERLGPVVAGLDDPVECIKAIEDEINRILDEVARPVDFK
jgi:hypothetical protein